MRQIYIINLFVFMLFANHSIASSNRNDLRKDSKINKAHTKKLRLENLSRMDSVLDKRDLSFKKVKSTDTIKVVELSKYPVVTLEQMMKGNISGIYVQESSAEPGTIQQNMLVRGLTRPLFEAKNFKESRPLVIVNGIPLVEDTDIVYTVQNEETQPIGSATNVLSLFDLDNIESISVLKDASQVAKYGPRASNGVIYIQTKIAKGGDKRITLNGYTGIAVPNNVTTINAEFERNLRQPFYDKYATADQLAAYPNYLSDSSNVNYYGPSNWVDLYYKVSPLYTINGSLTGGNARSSFRFFGNHTYNTSGADDTKFNKTFGNFNVQMMPTTWMTIDGNIQIGRLSRDRNKSLTERYSETKYVPDLSTPLAPNKNLYSLYLDNFDKLGLDDNLNTSVLASLGATFNLMNNFTYNSRVSLDYKENRRDLFWPSGLMENNNYASNFLGYNERFFFDNHLAYQKELDWGKLLLEGGFSTQADKHKYNYIQAYRGPNDYIKVNKVSGDKSKAEYLQSIGFIPYLYSDKTVHNLVSGYAKATLAVGDLDVSALVRRDGSSWQQLSERWFTSYAFDASYDLKKSIGGESLNFFKIYGSYGRLGNLANSDTEASGPQYTSQLGWDKNTLLMSYNGIGTVSRPYSYGWVSYDVPWAYTDSYNIGLDILIANQFGLKADYYNKVSKNMLIPIPTVAESGYKFQYASGMDVKNNGIDVTLSYSLPKNNSSFGWNASVNVGYNNNELLRLPEDLSSIVVGSRKLEVGNRIDRYWLLQNRGIYESDLDVPVNATNYKILSYNGTDMKGGDPRWIDQDGNFDINNDDRVLMGNIIPKWVGGFHNQFTYKNFDLSTFFYFNLQREILNQQAAKYYDFANVSDAGNLYGVREITYWEQNFDPSTYPIYNTWSSVVPYQTEQDMFMEDGSFLKLKNASLGYDFTHLFQQKKFNRVYAYVSGTNLLTITKYSGRDPELVNFYGYDTGTGIRFPKMYTLGFKLDF